MTFNTFKHCNLRLVQVHYNILIENMRQIGHLISSESAQKLNIELV